MRKKHFRCFCVLLCCQSVLLWNCQRRTQPTSLIEPRLDNPTERWVAKIAEENVLTSEAIGRGGTPARSYQYFDSLMQKSDTQELITLTSHDNGVVRSYAFWGLAKQKSKKIPDILLRRIGDNEKIQVIMGDVAESMMVADFMLKLLSTDDIDPDCYKLSPAREETFRQMRTEQKKLIKD